MLVTVIIYFQNDQSITDITNDPRNITVILPTVIQHFQNYKSIPEITIDARHEKKNCQDIIWQQNTERDKHF